jgi:ABC-type multidrug transport system ATPase subunit
MDEASRCSRIALMQDGNVMEVDSLENIIAKNNMILFALRSKEMHRLLKDLREYPGTFSAFAFGDEHHVRLDSEEEAEQLYAYLLHRGHELLNIRKINPEIEDVFIQLMQEQNT